MHSSVVFLALVFVVAVSAHRCDYESKMEKHYLLNPGARDAVMAARDVIAEKIRLQKLDNSSSIHARGTVQLNVPVVWHILYHPDLPGSFVTEAQIAQEMTWLNDWFSAGNVNYGSASAHFFSDIATGLDLNINFVLATSDPNGVSHKGIEYRETNVANTCGQNEIVTTSQGGLDAWDNLQFMNIHTCNIGALGYAFLPGGGTFPADGMVLQYPQLGDSFFSGSTISHEMGHWLGLPHTFEGCGAGDGISDTPPTDMPAFDYNTPQAPCPGIGGAVDSDFQRCSGIVMVQNNMDYNFEECLSYFSKDQAATMRGFVEGPSIRDGLTSSIGFTPQCPTFDCTGKQCGDDGCGGQCGTCDLNIGSNQCDPNGNCVACPTFDCTGKECGDNGCGGVCGTCGSGQTCTGSFQCDSPNESCATALQVNINPSTSNYPGSNIGSNIPETTCSSQQSNPNIQVNHPIYYTFTSTVDGTVSLDTAGSLMDTTMTVFQGSCGSLTCLAYNDDENYPAILTSRVDFAIAEGETYVIVIGGFADDIGNFVFNTILTSSDPSASTTPSAAANPSASTTPSAAANPSQSNTPAANPSQSSTPAANPSQSNTPAANPSQSNTPAANPSQSSTPQANPSQSRTPQANPSTSSTPAANPSQSSTPAANPSQSRTPQPSPSDDDESTFTTDFSTFFTTIFTTDFSTFFSSGYSSFTSLFTTIDSTIETSEISSLFSSFDDTSAFFFNDDDDDSDDNNAAVLKYSLALIALLLL